VFNDYESMAYADESNRPDRKVGEDYRLSSSYATSQLPLVAPQHPDVVASDLTLGYDTMGTYRSPRFSVAVFVPPAQIFNNHDVAAILSNLRDCAASEKIAWDSLEARREKLHATVCGGLESRMGVSELAEFVSTRLAGLAPFVVRLYGPWFFGPKNGRLYLPMVAERTFGDFDDPLLEMQRRLGQPAEHNGFYVGFLNLVDHLERGSTPSRHEADSLFSVLEATDRQVVAEFVVRSVSIIATHDDLILDSTLVATIPL